MAGSSDDNKSLALFCDFENIALGVRDAKYQKFDISYILEKLLVKGSIVVKKAYCDWARYKDFKVPMHEASFELIDIPHVRQSGKNSADIRMVVDALDLCYTKAHVDTFVIISGDSDFSPLVSKLRENAKTVIGVGVKNSTSDLLINNCDEFIYYDDLVRELERKRPGRKRTKKRSSSRNGTDKVVDEANAQATTDEDSADTAEPRQTPAKTAAGKAAETAAGTEPDTTGTTKRKRGKAAKVVEPVEPVDSIDDEASSAEDNGEELIQEGLELLLETAADLSADRDGNDKLWGSMVKQTLKRRRPGFNESYYGFESFGKMLEEAQARGYLTLELDDRSGGYIIRKVIS